MDNAFEFIMKNGGITSEELYPYVSGNGTTGTCKARLIKTKVAHISDFCDVIPKNETDLELALNQQVLPCSAPLQSRLVVALPYAVIFV